MTVTTTTRMGVRRWSAGTDPLTRAQLDAAMANLEQWAGRFEEGLLSARPAAGIRDRYFYATDTGVLYRDTAAAWVVVGAVTAGKVQHKMAAGQTGNLLELLDAAGTADLGHVDVAGLATILGVSVDALTQAAQTARPALFVRGRHVDQPTIRVRAADEATGNGPVVEIQKADGTVQFTLDNALAALLGSLQITNSLASTAIPLTVRNVTAAADLQRWSDAGNVVVARVDSAGRFDGPADAARMSRSTTQSIPYDADTVIDFTTTDYALGAAGLVSLAGNTFVAQKQGIHAVKGFARFALPPGTNTAAGAYVGIGIWVNGVNDARVIHRGEDDIQHSIQCVWEGDLDPGDTVDVRVRQVNVPPGGGPPGTPARDMATAWATFHRVSAS